MKARNWVIAGSMVVITVLSYSLYAGSRDSQPRFPEEYRDWPFAKAKLIPPAAPGTGGFRHHYANRKAARSWGTGIFDEGSVIVDERVESVMNANGVWVEGKVLHVAVMKKDSHRYADTGGWGFNIFMGDDRTVGLTPEQARASCFEPCHKSQIDRDFVFSDYRR
ncbi:MAG TPA: cytochrome P460 family protein [Povalibacter sp.]|nr:cytochrome P460 family protein [Povalibacter sp.]